MSALDARNVNRTERAGNNLHLHRDTNHSNPLLRNNVIIFRALNFVFHIPPLVCSEQDAKN